MLARLIQLVALLFLAGCQTHSGVITKPKMATIPYSLKQACKSPQDIPDGDLTYDDALIKWSKDRASLDECGIRHKALSDASTALENQ